MKAHVHTQAHTFQLEFNVEDSYIQGIDDYIKSEAYRFPTKSIYYIIGVYISEGKIAF